MFKQFKNKKFILHSGIFDQEKPRTVVKLCSLPCMDIAWEMCTAYTNCREEAIYHFQEERRGAEDKGSHKIVINYEN